MASQKIIPRFLLPQSSWVAPLPRHGGNTAVHAQAHALRRNHTISNSTPPFTKPVCSIPGVWHRGFVPRSAHLRPSTPAPKCFSTSGILQRDHHFDTLKFVQRLRDEGFSEEQSKAMMLVLSDVIEESIQNLTRTMVLKEGEAHQQRSMIVTVRELQKC